MVEGNWESQHTLQATKISVLQAWRERHDNVAFKPQPSSLHCRAAIIPAARQQPDQQQQDGASQLMMPGVSLPAAPQLQQTALMKPEGSASTDFNVLRNSNGSTAGPSAPARLQQPHEQLQEPQLAVCKFWLNSGRCAKGSACPYAHLQASALRPTKAKWLKDRHQRRQVLASALGCCHSESAAAKGRRAQLFAGWLVGTYGKEALNTGAGVVDVAGGAGWMTYELTVVHGVKCTLVDPRPLKLNKWQHKQLDRLSRSAVLTTWTTAQLQQQEQQSVRTEQSAFNGSCEGQQSWMPGEIRQLHPLPGQRQDSSQETLEELQQQIQQNPHQEATPGLQLQPVAQQAAVASLENVENVQLKADCMRTNQQDGNSSIAENVVQLQQVQGWFGSELWHSSGWQQILGSCSLVIGLHPDQATEAIVDYAVQGQKPFAVAPCCVFPRQFPHRQLVKPVVSYAELVEYLVDKADAQQQVLPFEGANTVVYRK
eukprot:GHUV01014805.1.p1 GENE.GHUV01014805.1~~GHUV01014805.1.p1  ORF type:complete len:485 (+),score=155.37 GHUV01014805.1:561-2015(+)